MRVLVWAIAAGLALGAAIGWWSLQRDRDRGPVDPAGTTTGVAGTAGNPGADAPPPRLYRWRDDAGTLHITDRPPAGRPYEEVKIRADQNVVSLQGPAPEPEAAPAD
jgi:hypothetical protein